MSCDLIPRMLQVLGFGLSLVQRSMVGHSCNSGTPNVVDQEFVVLLSYIVNLILAWLI